MASTLLIVDDDESAVRLMEEVLDSADYQILSATGGEEALVILEQDGVDLLVTDLYMLGMHGQELLANARVPHPNLPALLITGSSQHLGAGDWGEAANCVLLYKPFTTSELRAAVAEALKAA